MFLYYDKTGVLREIINDGSLRQGDHEVDTIYVYVEELDYVSAAVSYLLPDGETFVGPQAVSNRTELQIPFDAKRDLKYFRYYKDYEFLAIPLQADQNDDTLGNGPLDQTGTVHCQISIILSGGSVKQLGEFNFHVEESPVTNLKYVSTQEWLSLSDYQYLVGQLGNALKTQPNTTTVYTQSTTGFTVRSASPVTGGYYPAMSVSVYTVNDPVFVIGGWLNGAIQYGLRVYVDGISYKPKDGSSWTDIAYSDIETGTHAAQTYLTMDDAEDTYLTITDAAQTYLAKQVSTWGYSQNSDGLQIGRSSINPEGGTIDEYMELRMISTTDTDATDIGITKLPMLWLSTDLIQNPNYSDDYSIFVQISALGIRFGQGDEGGQFTINYIPFKDIETKSNMATKLGATHWDGSILNLFSDGSGNVVSFYGSLHYMKADRTLCVKGVIRVRALGSDASNVYEIPVTQMYEKLGLSAANVDPTQGAHWCGTGLPWSGDNIVYDVMGAGEMVYLGETGQTIGIGRVSNVNSGAMSLWPLSTLNLAGHMVDFMIHFTE